MKGDMYYMFAKRIISTLLMLLMLVSSMSLVISAAAEPAEGSTVAYEYDTKNSVPTMDYMTGLYKESGMATPDDEDPGYTITTPQQKLDTMDLRLEQNGYRLYVDAYSGEVAVECVATGETLFTNPYDVSSKKIQEDKKAEMLSQIIVSFEDTSNNNEPKTFDSFKYAVKGGGKYDFDFKNPISSQIEVKYIKNGIRVEYAIGRLDSRYLVPERISYKNFQEKILNVAKEAGISDFEYKQLNQIYFEHVKLSEKLKPFAKNPEEMEKQRESLLKTYPMLSNNKIEGNIEDGGEGGIYVCTAVTKKEFKALETIIKKYCPDYSYEDLDSEHLRLGYVPPDKNEALFNIALEYTIDANGLSVRLPANGIRFDESIYRLENIEILPYMGAGANPNSGYTFFPDGSGALFDFEELAKKSGDTYFYGTVYGEDFGYYNIGTGSPHNETVRYPVFGLKETIKNSDGTEKNRGYLAVIEEGDAMMQLFSYHCAQYNTVRMRFNPRPYDEYKLSDAISVAGDAVWTVVSQRKYTGNFTIRYIMLTDKNVATGKGYYDTSYVGMAKAYRDYLVGNGTLTKLTADDVREDIPLYIETFGALETTEKFLSVPYNTMKALTSFADIKKMYDKLEENGISNINFILTGYTDGGLNVDQIPYNLNWDNSVEKEMKFEELLKYAGDENFGIYPDFDFVFSSTNKLFDGLTLSKHAVKTIDGRYTSKREYSTTRQTFVSYFELAISPAYFSHFYEKLSDKYSKYDPAGISVSTLGSYLTSDFDEKEPYHREDSEEFTVEAFKYLDERYSVMTSGGNAYSWKYVDYITDVAIDSSRHARSSATVPFLGIALHGFIQTTGSAVNMEGNIDYAILRAIENGASLKFILSYKNTELLKLYEDTSVYYSVRYDIWLNDLVERYNDINEALKDVQTSTIEQHVFLNDAVRIPNANEILGDAENELFNSIASEIAGAANEKEALRIKLQSIRKNLLWAIELLDVDTRPDNTEGKTVFDYYYEEVVAIYDEAKGDKLESLKKAITAVAKQEIEKDNAKAAWEADPNVTTLQSYNYQLGVYNSNVVTMRNSYEAYMKAVNSALSMAEAYNDKYTVAYDNFDMLKEHKAFTDEIIAELELIRNNADLRAIFTQLKTYIDTIKTDSKAEVSAIEEKYASELGLVKNDVAEEVFDKYAAADNSVVYEVYENGKAFILNFNNYAIKVKHGEVYYSVDAYGYVVVS